VKARCCAPLSSTSATCTWMATSQLPEEPHWGHRDYPNAVQACSAVGTWSWDPLRSTTRPVFSIKQLMFSVGRSSFSPSRRKEGEDSRLQEGVAATAVCCSRKCGPRVHSLWKHDRRKQIITEGKLYKDWCGETR